MLHWLGALAGGSIPSGNDRETAMLLCTARKYPGNFGSTGIDDLDYTLIVTIKVDALGCPMDPPQMAYNINCI